MIHLIRIINQNTKGYKNNHYRYLAVRISCMIFTALFFAGFCENQKVRAASGLKLYNYSTDSTSTYTGNQVKATCNGSKIGNSNYPGILVDGVALLPYYDIFDQLPIDADCVYDYKKNAISISKYNITILMTIGSKKALVNKNEVTLPAAPMKIKYVAAGKMKVLVPSRFVSETLGLGYSWKSITNTVAITKPTLMLSYNNGAKFEYRGTKGKVTLDGKNINLGKTPSIIINNTAMLCAYKVFSASKIGATYTFDKATQTITFTKDSNVLVMTVGNKTAYLNNNPITLPAAPVYVTNYEAKTSYVMVPGQITASSLGYSYQWNNSTRTSIITTKSTNNNSENTGTDPELGDSGDITETGTILNQWTSDATQYGVCTGVHEMSESTASSNIGSINIVSRDYTTPRQNAETFMIASDTPFQKISSEAAQNKITVITANQSCIEQSYPMSGTSSNFINTIRTYNHSESSSSTIEFEVLKEKYDYDISLSEDRKVLYVTVYLNTITSALIGTNSTGDYLKLSGLKPLETIISEASGYIYLDFPNTANSLGYLNSELQGAKYIKQIFVITAQEKTQIVLLLNDGYHYSTHSKDNEFSISFQSTGSTVPVVIDKSDYEIVIPKPENINASMISDEDHYFYNYFNVILQGDCTEFLNSYPITNTSDTVNKISVSLNSEGNTVIKVATSKLQGYKIASDNENIYINVGNPRDIYKNIVLLDPGHGGGATGAHYNGVYEKDLNLKILYTLGKQYFNKDTTKLKVYYTRTTDVDMSIYDRAAFAKKMGADLFVSLHMNAIPQSYIEGTEVFYSNVNNKANSAGLTSKALAAFFDDSIPNAIGTADRGVKQAGFVVTKNNTIPAVLIELGYMTNSKDFAILTDESCQKKAVETIYETLLQVFSSYPTGR